VSREGFLRLACGFRFPLRLDYPAPPSDLSAHAPRCLKFLKSIVGDRFDSMRPSPSFYFLGPLLAFKSSDDFPSVTEGFPPFLGFVFHLSS